MSHQYNFNQLQAIARVSGAYLPESGETENAFANDLATFNDEQLGGKFGTEGYRLVRDRIDTEIRLAKEEEEENADRQLENIGLMEDIRKDLQRAQSVKVNGYEFSAEEIALINDIYNDPQQKDALVRREQERHGGTYEEAEERVDKQGKVVTALKNRSQGTHTQDDIEILEDASPQTMESIEDEVAIAQQTADNNRGYLTDYKVSERAPSFAGIDNGNTTALRDNFASAANITGNDYSDLKPSQQNTTIEANMNTLGLG